APMLSGFGGELRGFHRRRTVAESIPVSRHRRTSAMRCELRGACACPRVFRLTVAKLLYVERLPPSQSLHVSRLQICHGAICSTRRDFFSNRSTASATLLQLQRVRFRSRGG